MRRLDCQFGWIKEGSQLHQGKKKLFNWVYYTVQHSVHSLYTRMLHLSAKVSFPVTLNQWRLFNLQRYPLPLNHTIYNTLLVPLYACPETFCLERFQPPSFAGTFCLERFQLHLSRGPFASSVFNTTYTGDFLPRAFSTPPFAGTIWLFTAKCSSSFHINHLHFQLFTSPLHSSLSFYCCLFFLHVPRIYVQYATPVGDSLIQSGGLYNSNICSAPHQHACQLLYNINHDINCINSRPTYDL